MNKVTLFEEYRLIEKCESEVNGAWRGAHLLLFFLAFVFGSFCTFCFHMLMYLFDEKCVLFPKLLSLSSTRHNVIYEFIPNSKDTQDLPVDFLSTQWVEKNACTLPTYVPLLSGIFGLVWTTMFLMCSTGSRTLTGLQRPWRLLPPVFVFSLAMGSLCVYSSVVTHYGLQELCYKLGEITGSSTCTYTVNVATLAYERRIRGVYQATRLTILTAWLHTACWVLSALLAILRVLLAVDFQLVRVNVDLRGDIDKMLQLNEQQIRTVSPDPDLWITDDNQSIGSHTSKVHFKRNNRSLSIDDELAELHKQPSDILYFSHLAAGSSDLSLVPAERQKLTRQPAYKTVPKDKRFIIDILYDIIDSISVAEMIYESTTALSSSSSLSESGSGSTTVTKQTEQEVISKTPSPKSAISTEEAELLATDTKQMRQTNMDDQSIELFSSTSSSARSSAPKIDPVILLSAKEIADELKLILENPEANNEQKSSKKSNLKSVGIQTEKPKGHVQISKSVTKLSEESVPKMQDDTNEANDNTNETDEKEYVGEEIVSKNKDLEDIKTEHVAEAYAEKHDDDEAVTMQKVDEEVVEKNIDKTSFEKEDNAGIHIKEDSDIEVFNKLDVSNTELVDEVINKEDDVDTVVQKLNLDETVIDLQDDDRTYLLKETDDAEVDNLGSDGEVSVNDGEEEVTQGVADKQTQSKPKEKQD